MHIHGAAPIGHVYLLLGYKDPKINPSVQIRPQMNCFHRCGKDQKASYSMDINEEKKRQRNNEENL